MRTPSLAPNEYYHLFNRGNGKQQIFLDDADRARFLFLILHLQSPVSFTNMGYHPSLFLSQKTFAPTESTLSRIVTERYVELNNFCLMGNHFHITMFEKKEGGISKYMHRVLIAYTKYFNERHKRKGHLFEGKFKAVHVTDNTQLLHLSTYIHRNPRELPEWRAKIFECPWSSLPDYVGENRWGPLLCHEIISEQFGETADIQHKGYRRFIDTSTAKSFSERLPEHLID